MSLLKYASGCKTLVKLRRQSALTALFAAQRAAAAKRLFNMDDAASSREELAAPAAATDPATTQEAPQRAAADVTDLLTAELDAAVAAAAPQRTDSTDLLTA